MLVDTHCHIYKSYYDDIDEIIKKIKKNKIAYIINNACDYDTSLEVLNLSNKYDFMFCVLGVHPSENLSDVDKVIALIRDNKDNDKMIGIGEIGLDYYYGKEKKEEQLEIFKRQLDLAEELNLPVIIHSREATKDTLDILKNYDLKGIIHCFNGSFETAREYINLGFKIGVNGVVTFKNCKLIEVIGKLSLRDIVFETDSPYLTPVPFRGKQNDPSYVNNIVDFVGEYLNISRDELIKCSFENIKEVFRI